MKQDKLIQHYEANLTKCIDSYGGNKFKADYIAYAELQLEAAKKGGIEELKKLWSASLT